MDWNQHCNVEGHNAAKRPWAPWWWLMATWNYSDASSRYCHIASSRRCSIASSRCCNTTSSRRYNVAALLQHASWERCYSLRCGSATIANVTAALVKFVSRYFCGTITTRIAGAQWCYCNKRHSNIVAARVIGALLQQALRQRYGATLARVVVTLQ
jgi:hypothetical protein